MSLFQSIQDDLKTAQLAKVELTVSVLRMLLSELKNSQIQKGEELQDSEITQVIQKEIKKRSESKEAFEKAGRVESAQKESEESEVLKKYLPEQLSDENLAAIIDEAITQTGATGVSDMGRVIGIVMSKAAGQVDGTRVSSAVKERLING